MEHSDEKVWPFFNGIHDIGTLSYPTPLNSPRNFLKHRVSGQNHLIAHDQHLQLVFFFSILTCSAS